jgi:hypothetical protein
MPKLNQDIVAGFQLAQHFVPQTLTDKGAAAAASAGSINHIEPGKVKVISKRIAPPARPVGVVVSSRVANDKDAL